MATILVRALDANWEPQQGLGQSNFLSDLNAVAQIIAQRLKLLQGEWWENTNDGLPFWQQIAGYRGGANNRQKIDLLIQQTIFSAPFVTGVTNVQSSYDSTTRAYTFSAVVQTQFGAIVVTNSPTPPSQSLPQ